MSELDEMGHSPIVKEEEKLTFKEAEELASKSIEDIKQKQEEERKAALLEKRRANMRKAQAARKAKQGRKKLPTTGEKPNTPTTGQTKRKERKPVGLRSPVKKTETRPGYHRRWVNDVEDRLQIFEEGGYEAVLDKDGSMKTRRAGAGRRQVLMEIPQELYDEDQQVKYAKWNKDAQERLKPREDVKGFYQPKIGPK